MRANAPSGTPMAIAISPVLTGRDAFGLMRDKILDAAPGSKLISVNAEGHADESVDEVEVLLRGWPFGARVVAIRRHPESAPVVGVEVLGGLEALPKLLAVSDLVVLALPLTAETEALINDAALAAAKPGSWLINVARGGLVDERALLGALRSGPIGGAALDTFRDEPLPESSPFYRLANCIVTPHTSWSSAEAIGRTLDVFCENLRRYRAGEPLLHVVDPALGY